MTPKVDVGKDIAIAYGDQTLSVKNPWWGNYGGHEVVVSDRYLVVWLYSGQSTQGWELFELAPKLRRIGGMRDTYGMGDAPTFSPDSSWLAHLVTVAPRWRDSGEHLEDGVDPDDDSVDVLDWARLDLQRLPDGPIEHFAIGSPVSRSIDPDDVFEWATYDALAFDTDHRLMIAMPWREKLVVTLPIAKAVTSTRGP